MAVGRVPHWIVGIRWGRKADTLEHIKGGDAVSWSAGVNTGPRRFSARRNDQGQWSGLDIDSLKGRSRPQSVGDASKVDLKGRLKRNRASPQAAKSGESRYARP